MKYWFLLLLIAGCVACSDSTPDKTTDAAQDEASQTPAMEEPQATSPQKPAQDTGTTTIVTEEIEYYVDNEPFTGFIAYDASVEGQRPGVLVVHEWWGHNEYARSRARQLAELGYTAFALDMYGAGKVTDHPEDAQQFMQKATESFDQAKARFLKAKEVLQEAQTTNPDQIAAIGYCFGGGVVLNMAKAGVGLDGVASFHGSLSSMVQAEPGAVDAKVLVLNGAADPFVPEEQIETFKAEMDAVGADYTFINYPGVKHSFTNPGATEVGEKYDMPLAYDKKADEKSWEELKQFLNSLWTAQ